MIHANKTATSNNWLMLPPEAKFIPKKARKRLPFPRLFLYWSFLNFIQCRARCISIAYFFVLKTPLHGQRLLYYDEDT